MDNLTHREVEVLSLLSQGMANKDIAASLGLTIGTIKNHVSILLSKTGTANRMYLAIKYLSKGS